MEAMQPSIEVTQEVDMQMVEEIAEEAGIEDPEMLLQEVVHHDHDEDQTLTVEELQSAAEVVVAQQEVMQEVTPEPEPEPAEEPKPEPNPQLTLILLSKRQLHASKTVIRKMLWLC